MSFITAKVTVPHNTGLPEDAVTNSFALVPAEGVARATAATAFTAELDTFYTALSAWLSSQYQWTAMQVEYVDLLDDRPRLPFVTQTFGISAVSTTQYDLPAEVSLCLTLVGSTSSGENARRRRGRVFIGPLQYVGQDLPTSSMTLATLIANAGLALTTNASYQQCIYSRYTHYSVPVGRNIGEKDGSGNPLFTEQPEALPSAFVPVDGVYVDNAWDIQRRRGPKATARYYGV